MKAPYLQFSKVLSYLMVFAVLVSMSSCRNSKYTASFQKVPAKTYAQKDKVQENVENTVEQNSLEQYIAEATEQDLTVEVPDDLMASLKELGISEKKSAKIQKRIEKITAAMEKAENGTEARTMNFAEKMMVKKVMKKADKILKENDIKDINDLEDSDKVQQRGNIVTGLILIVAGVVVAALVPGAGPIIGSIVAAIGVVLLVIGLLNRI